MSEVGGAGSPGSEDPDALAAELLSRFIGYKPPNPPSNENSAEETPPKSPAPDPIQKNDSSLEIVVPDIDNLSEYEYLPGHFAVRRIMKLISENPKKPVYTVRLRSGEQETMTYNRLMELENSSQALDEFNPDFGSSDDELVVTGRRRRRHRRSLLFSGDGADSSASDLDSKPNHRTSRRRRTTARPTYDHYFRIESESDSDQGSGDSESSADELAAQQQGRRSGRVAALNRRGASTTDRARRSTRRGKSSRSMRERLEDDLSEVESGASRQTKYSGAREVFREIPRDDEFRLRHFACCSTCNYYEDDEEKGPLVFCQGCTSSFHQLCLGPRGSREHLVTKIDEGNFVLQCRRCLGVSHEKHDIRPHLGRCAICREEGPMSTPLRDRLTSKEEQQLRIENGGTDPVTLIDMSMADNADNLLFRCTSCQRGFHIEHLPPMDGSDVSENFDRYGAHWQCHDCTDVPGEIEGSTSLAQSSYPLAQLVPEIDKDYLIKWKTKSYFRATWKRGDWVWGHSNHAMIRAFYNSPKALKPIFTAEEAIPEENLRIDILFEVTWRPDVKDKDREDPEMVEEVYVKYKGLNYEDSVWEAPPKPHETERWNDYVVAFQDWVRRDTIRLPNRATLKLHFETVRNLDFEHQLLLDVQPEMLTSGELMDYQLEGVNWLYYKIYQQKNAILADDMGLGKTVQVIGLLATLIRKHTCWPFLIVVPNSTVPNWRREIKTWAPEIQVVTYFGSAFARQTAKDQEMFPNNSRDLRCHVVIASYESMIDEEARKVLARINWAALVVDEGHRLKNDKSQLYERLSKMKFDFKVLLTGTPLQNNIRELFNLIQFIDPESNADDLEAQYGQLTQQNIRALHEMIRPFFLRRTKAEVLPFLPPMVQIIVPVSMSNVQKKLYKSILGKNPQLIRAICQKQTSELKKHERHNLNNILMQLRKCLCHPFVYSREIEEVTNDPILAHQRLVEASGKFQLLNLMLPKLRERGHRVLIFSQFLENLDLVEDFLVGSDLLYCRLDGKLAAREKQQQIDKFNTPDSPFFAFLLSTRSGGVGINLATADTVIIMDPDFNPKQDMQALSRAHRIGQKKPVLVFHLTTRSSVEEKIMEKGKKKMALEHVLIERMEADEEEEDLESILRHGAQALFDEDDSADHYYDAESIDRLLDRSQAEQAEKYDADTPGSSDQPQFSFARVWQKDRNTLEEVSVSEDKPVDMDIWEQILRDREHAAREEAYLRAEKLGRGKRKRPAISYKTREEDLNDLDMDVDKDDRSSSAQPSSFKKRKPNAADSDVEFQHDENELSDSNDGETPQDDPDFGTPPPKKTRPFRRVRVNAIVPNFGLDGAMDADAAPPRVCIVCNTNHEVGRCPVKEAGVEHCPLCGLPHLGGRRICPHFHSRVQIQRMMDALRYSNENPQIIASAKRYLQGVLSHLTVQERISSSMQPSTLAASSSAGPVQYQVPILGLQATPGPSQHPQRNLPQQNPEQPALTFVQKYPSPYVHTHPPAGQLPRADYFLHQPPVHQQHVAQTGQPPRVGSFVNHQPVSRFHFPTVPRPLNSNRTVVDLTGSDTEPTTTTSFSGAPRTSAFSTHHNYGNSSVSKPAN
ncbi:uncharacterized protein N7483_004402 [Penicillium malachiteum]|uniref:uncharacterized protein n=1 Tax=Penicillium malachiteum TaxID=1324776 RepID=UPI00254747CE|nr:uncharacterized protein N7483_004402 [Penicillium malachiteum]KAJ5729894.1 hypothetical protein N7483_004402 [Penicillium malachiteum]